MKIITDLTKDDYQKLIMEAQCDILNHISHKPIKMNIENNEIIGEMQCLGVKLTDGGRTIEGYPACRRESQSVHPVCREHPHRLRQRYRHRCACRA